LLVDNVQDTPSDEYAVDCVSVELPDPTATHIVPFHNEDNAEIGKGVVFDSIQVFPSKENNNLVDPLEQATYPSLLQDTFVNVLGKLPLIVVADDIVCDTDIL
jgi:hypothetical protein